MLQMPPLRVEDSTSVHHDPLEQRSLRFLVTEAGPQISGSARTLVRAAVE